MIEGFSSVYIFSKSVLDGWVGDSGIGVYYLGASAPTGGIYVYYIGSATGDKGLSGRLKDHLGKWRDITHFQFRRCSTIQEALDFEKVELAQYKPKYNTQGV